MTFESKESMPVQEEEKKNGPFETFTQMQQDAEKAQGIKARREKLAGDGANYFKMPPTEEELAVIEHTKREAVKAAPHPDKAGNTIDQIKEQALRQSKDPGAAQRLEVMRAAKEDAALREKVIAEIRSRFYEREQELVAFSEKSRGVGEIESRVAAIDGQIAQIGNFLSREKEVLKNTDIDIEALAEYRRIQEFIPTLERIREEEIGKDQAREKIQRSGTSVENAKNQGGNPRDILTHKGSAFMFGTDEEIAATGIDPRVQGQGNNIADASAEGEVAVGGEIPVETDQVEPIVMEASGAVEPEVIVEAASESEPVIQVEQEKPKTVAELVGFARRLHEIRKKFAEQETAKLAEISDYLAGRGSDEAGYQQGLAKLQQELKDIRSGYHTAVGLEVVDPTADEFSKKIREDVKDYDALLKLALIINTGAKTATLENEKMAAALPEDQRAATERFDAAHENWELVGTKTKTCDISGRDVAHIRDNPGQNTEFWPLLRTLLDKTGKSAYYKELATDFDTYHSKHTKRAIGDDKYLMTIEWGPVKGQMRKLSFTIDLDDNKRAGFLRGNLWDRKENREVVIEVTEFERGEDEEEYEETVTASPESETVAESVTEDAEFQAENPEVPAEEEVEDQETISTEGESERTSFERKAAMEARYPLAAEFLNSVETNPDFEALKPAARLARFDLERGDNREIDRLVEKMTDIIARAFGSGQIDEERYTRNQELLQAVNKELQEGAEAQDLQDFMSQFEELRRQPWNDAVDEEPREQVAETKTEQYPAELKGTDINLGDSVVVTAENDVSIRLERLPDNKLMAYVTRRQSGIAQQELDDDFAIKKGETVGLIDHKIVKINDPADAVGILSAQIVDIEIIKANPEPETEIETEDEEEEAPETEKQPTDPVRESIEKHQAGKFKLPQEDLKFFGKFMESSVAPRDQEDKEAITKLLTIILDKDQSGLKVARIEDYLKIMSSNGDAGLIRLTVTAEYSDGHKYTSKLRMDFRNVDFAADEDQEISIESAEIDFNI